MSTRITRKQLDALCDRINEATNSPVKPYSPDASGRHRAQIGCHYVSGAYGGYQLQRICNESGGVTTPTGGGYYPPRELYQTMSAYLAGLTTHNG